MRELLALVGLKREAGVGVLVLAPNGLNDVEPERLNELSMVNAGLSVGRAIDKLRCDVLDQKLTGLRVAEGQECFGLDFAASPTTCHGHNAVSPSQHRLDSVDAAIQFSSAATAPSLI